MTRQPSTGRRCAWVASGKQHIVTNGFEQKLNVGNAVETGSQRGRGAASTEQTEPPSRFPQLEPSGGHLGVLGWAVTVHCGASGSVLGATQHRKEPGGREVPPRGSEKCV